MDQDPKMQTFKAQNYSSRLETLQGWQVGITTYQLDDVFHCKVDNVSPGAVIARGRGTSQAEAEQQALGIANVELAKTVRR